MYYKVNKSLQVMYVKKTTSMYGMFPKTEALLLILKEAANRNLDEFMTILCEVEKALPETVLNRLIELGAKKEANNNRRIGQ